MADFPVTVEMLAAGRDAGAMLSAKGVFTDQWWAGVYRAMREVEPRLACRGELVEILCGTTKQIEAATARDGVFRQAGVGGPGNKPAARREVRRS